MPDDRDAGHRAVVPVSTGPDAGAWLDRLEAHMREPLLMLPMDWRPVVFAFWGKWGHLIKDALFTLCLRVNDYRASGLTLGELRVIFARVNAREAEKPVIRSGELFGQIVAHVSDAIKQRKAAAKAAAAREVDAEAAKVTASVATSFLERFKAGK